MDRRTKYTKRVLNDSLIRFLGEKDITKITVTELCTDADVNRSTYYAYFINPYDQLAQLKEELLRDLTEYIVQKDTSNMPKNQVLYEVLKILVEYVESKKVTFRILLGKSGDHNLQDELLKIVGKKAFHEELERVRQEDAKHILLYAANGCFGIFYDWLISDGIPAEVIARQMADLTEKLFR